MEYKVVYGYSTGEIKQKVEELLEQGWQLQGGVSFVCEDSQFMFAQALVKKD